jgi:hypothetical protein
MRRRGGPARRRSHGTESRVDLTEVLGQAISEHTLKANVETAKDARGRRQKGCDGRRHMGQQGVASEKQSGLVKRRKDKSTAPRRLIKPSTKLLEVVKSKTKAIRHHAETQQDLGKDFRLDPAGNEDELRRISDRAFAEFPNG